MTKTRKMKALSIILCLATMGLSAQTKRVTETVELSGETRLELEFDFADEIVFKVWDKEVVKVEVDVEINDGANNDAFSLTTRKWGKTVNIEMDKDIWEKIAVKKRRDRNMTYTYNSDISYTIYLPKSMEVKANTISGNYEFEYFGRAMELRTISGAIDVTIPEDAALDFTAKTISGEVFTDIDISFPHGKGGLHQIVGQDVYGRISTGGDESEFETICGNIFLRKG